MTIRTFDKKNPIPSSVFCIMLVGLLAALLLLGGCATTGGLPTSTKQPVCEALIGPLRYNSHNTKSAYHAGRKLAPQLAVRNRVGTNLGCPAYKR